MSTRSWIALYSEMNKTYYAIRCHWDGYPEFNGRLLFQHYNSYRLVAGLITGGNFNSLGETLTACDWVESGECGSIEYSSIKHLKSEFLRSDASFLYVYKNDNWMCLDAGGKDEFVLVELLLNLKPEPTGYVMWQNEAWVPARKTDEMTKTTLGKMCGIE